MVMLRWLLAKQQATIAGVGIFGVGFTTVPVAVTDKYTYSGDTVAAGTSLGTARTWPGATGNSTVGIFSAGATEITLTPTAVTDKYTYSGDVRTAGTSLGTARERHGAAGNSTVGIFGAGRNAANANIATTEKYTYSGDTVAAGTSLGTARRNLTGCSSAHGGL